MKIPGRTAYRLYCVLWTAIDWLYPPACGGCNQRGARWCENCMRSVQTLPVTICPVCGEVQDCQEICAGCRADPPWYTAVRAWGVFEGNLRNAIHRLKYRNNIPLAEALARPMIAYLRQLAWPVDLVTPIPLGTARLRERGYNQAELLARPMAWACNIEFHPSAVKRARETRSQVGLTAQQRKQNVSGAFEAWHHLVTGRNVLLVDDVATTGATMNACAAALRAAGARSVYGLTLARPSNRFNEAIPA